MKENKSQLVVLLLSVILGAYLPIILPPRVKNSAFLKLLLKIMGD